MRVPGRQARLLLTSFLCSNCATHSARFFLLFSCSQSPHLPSLLPTLNTVLYLKNYWTTTCFRAFPFATVDWTTICFRAFPLANRDWTTTGFRAFPLATVDCRARFLVENVKNKAKISSYPCWSLTIMRSVLPGVMIMLNRIPATVFPAPVSTSGSNDHLEFRRWYFQRC